MDDLCLKATVEAIPTSVNLLWCSNVAVKNKPRISPLAVSLMITAAVWPLPDPHNSLRLVLIPLVFSIKPDVIQYSDVPGFNVTGSYSAFHSVSDEKLDESLGSRLVHMYMYM